MAQLVIIDMKNSNNGNLKFEQNLYGALKCMILVISALFLRETYSLYGREKFGYFWVLLRTVFGIGLIIAIRMMLGIEYREGLHIIFFLLAGFVLYFIFAESVTKCLNAITANSSLLSFPHVIPLDIMISRCLLVVFTNLQAGFLISVIAICLGIEFEITNLILFWYCLIAVSAFGFSFGLFLSSLSVFYPIFNKLWPLCRRILFFTSGVFFSTKNFSSHFVEVLNYNPLLQLIEGFRNSISHNLIIFPTLSMWYVLFFILGCLSLGLLLEQASHRRLEQ